MLFQIPVKFVEAGAGGGGGGGVLENLLAVITFKQMVLQSSFNPFTLCPSLTNFRAEKGTDAPAKRVVFGRMAHLLSMLRVLIKILSHARAKKKTKRLKDFKFRFFIGRFSDIVAVRGLNAVVD